MVILAGWNWCPIVCLIEIIERIQPVYLDLHSWFCNCCWRTLWLWTFYTGHEKDSRLRIKLGPGSDTLPVGSKPIYRIKKMLALLFFYFFACDKIFEMRIKNFINILDKIKWLSYALKKSWCDIQCNGPQANWSSYLNCDLVKKKLTLT